MRQYSAPNPIPTKYPWPTGWAGRSFFNRLCKFPLKFATVALKWLTIICFPCRNDKVGALEKAQARQQAMHFMRGIMDEFTHIANYSRPVDCSSIVVVAALADAYVPRGGGGDTDLADLWPGAEIRYVPTGHVGAYVFHHQMFRYHWIVNTKHITL